MRIILQKDVKNLGQAGQVVSVKNGYARYFLFPKKYAVPYTKAGAKEMAHREKWITAKQKKALLVRQSQIEKLQNIQVSFAKEADSSGHLFGSVTVSDIVRELEKQGHEIPKRWIVLERPFKAVGEHQLSIQPDSQTGSASIQVCITATVKKTSKEAASNKSATRKKKVVDPKKVKDSTVSNGKISKKE